MGTSFFTSETRGLREETTREENYYADRTEELQLELKYEINRYGESVLTAGELEHGDLLFPRGGDFESKLIETGCGTTYSHVGTVVKVSPRFVLVLADFVQSLPDDWERVGFDISKTLSLFEEIGADVLNSGPGVRNCLNKGSVKLYPGQIAESKRLTYADWEEWFDGFQRSSPREYNTYYKHVLSLICAYEYLCSSRDLMAAITEEVNSIADEDKELYYWESTTDDTMMCLLKGNIHPGVKLTKLKDRVCGYEGIMGIRRVRNEEGTTGPTERVKMISLVCNVMMNHGKPYQVEYFDMIFAAFYAKQLLFCGSGTVCDDSQEDSSSSCCYYGCRPSVFANDYHFASEYDSMYCTEMAMQLLLDYQTLIWFEQLLFAKTRTPQISRSSKNLSVIDRETELDLIESVRPIYYASENAPKFVVSPTDNIDLEDGSFFYGRTFDNNFDPNEGGEFYNALGQLVVLHPSILNVEDSVSLQNVYYLQSIRNRRYSLQRRPVWWLGLGFVIESLVRRLSRLTGPDGGLDRVTGTPRTNVEVLYLTAVLDLPLDFKLTEIRHYKRMLLGLETIEPQQIQQQHHHIREYANVRTTTTLTTFQ